ncbi:MAG: hypothetical protein HZA92_18905 [Verrucomicrobia bacterium]|nr:hypothetical protein [Verrucomicrobiota bacterium]
MRRLAFAFLIACGIAVTGCRKKPAAPPAPKPPASPAPAPAGPVFRLHFAGLNSLSTDPDNAKLNGLLNSQEAIAMRRQTCDRLAVSLADTIFGADASHRARRAALLRPLLDDLAASKFLLSVPDSPGGSWLLTVFLTPSQRASWSTNLWQATDSPPVALPAVTASNSAWSTKIRNGSLLTVAVFDDCLMLGKSASGTPAASSAAGSSSAGHPALSPNLIDITADLPRLQAALGLPKSIAWPHLSVSVTAKGQTLRSEATLKFASAAPWKLDAFRLPTNSVRDSVGDPLISFTAVQGFGNWLAHRPEFKEWELLSTPNQLFTWARKDVPYNLLAAVPMADASNTVVRAAPHALHSLGTNITKAGIGRIAFTTNRTEIGWVGMPILVPFVRPAPEPDNDFLLFGSMAGIVPTGPNTNPPPVELLNQFLPRTNLVYYDWEITEAKLAQWMPIFQLTAMLSPNPSFPGAAAANQWLRAVSPKLGNTITEVTAVSPTELKAVRRSELGLTAIELTVLTRWLDNPAFPAFAYPTNAMPGLPTMPGAKK